VVLEQQWLPLRADEWTTTKEVNVTISATLPDGTKKSTEAFSAEVMGSLNEFARMEEEFKKERELAERGAKGSKSRSKNAQKNRKSNKVSKKLAPKLSPAEAVDKALQAALPSEEEDDETICGVDIWIVAVFLCVVLALLASAEWVFMVVVGGTKII
jgi:hypothetical protein